MTLIISSLKRIWKIIEWNISSEVQGKFEYFSHVKYLLTVELCLSNNLKNIPTAFPGSRTSNFSYQLFGKETQVIYFHFIKTLLLFCLFFPKSITFILLRHLNHIFTWLKFSVRILSILITINIFATRLNSRTWRFFLRWRLVSLRQFNFSFSSELFARVTKRYSKFRKWSFVFLFKSTLIDQSIFLTSGFIRLLLFVSSHIF